MRKGFFIPKMPTGSDRKYFDDEFFKITNPDVKTHLARSLTETVFRQILAEREEATPVILESSDVGELKARMDKGENLTGVCNSEVSAEMKSMLLDYIILNRLHELRQVKIGGQDHDDQST